MKILSLISMLAECGIGKCGRCNIGHLYVCKDSPMFSYGQLEKLPKDY